MQYKHFSVEEREALWLMKVEKRSLRHMARVLDRSPSSVSRELRKNVNGRNRYTPRLAEERALEKRKCRGRKGRLKNERVREYVVSKLKSGWSPEQIAGRIWEDSGERISHEAIYQYVYAQVHREGWGLLRLGCEDLRPYLKRRHKRRVRKGLRATKKVPKFNGKSIDERPSVVATRSRIGDWEGDSMVSGKSKEGLNTLVERVSGLVLITRVNDGTAEATQQAVVERMKTLSPASRKTLTLDNGSENALWREIEEQLPGLSAYLAHPYASFERGTNENTNGLIRWYFPKGTDFVAVSDDEIRAVEYALNHRPRKRLHWKTPVEVFREGVALHG